jgi:prepilin-type N-terminal cleavage/methylation domain-containing protein
MKKAFTLIELLVVIAVIAILAALLMPALQRARDEARKAACKNNIHSIGMALSTYRQAHGEDFPLTLDVNAPDNRWCNPWGRLLSEGHVDSQDVFACPNAAGEISVGDRFIPRIAEPGSHDHSRAEIGNDGNSGETDWEIGKWSDVIGGSYAYGNHRIPKTLDPARAVVADGMGRVMASWTDEEINEMYQLDTGQNHGDGAVVLFADNSARFLQTLYPYMLWTPKQNEIVDYWNAGGAGGGNQHSNLTHVRAGVIQNDRIEEDSNENGGIWDDHDDIYAIEVDSEADHDASSNPEENYWEANSIFEFYTGYTDLADDGGVGAGAVSVATAKKDAALGTMRNFLPVQGVSTNEQPHPYGGTFNGTGDVGTSGTPGDNTTTTWFDSDI